MDVKVSVILPSLNVKDYIEEAVRSAMCQTLREIELICIDAGSVDGTWEALLRLAESDERVILRRSDVKSYGYQVNMGLDMAKGEYVAILETDDYIDSGMYERLYQEAVLHDCDYVKSDYFIYRTQSDGTRAFFRRYLFGTDDLYGKIMEPKKNLAIAIGDWYLWNGIYKKEFLRNCNIHLSETPGAAYQDIGFIFRTNILSKRALYLKEPYYRYCVEREGASANSGKGLQYAYWEFSGLYETIKEKEEDYEVLKVFYCRMAKSFIYCCEGMEDGNMRIADKNKAEYYQWFRQQLKSAVKRNMVDRTLFNPKAWNMLEELLVSEEYYLEQRRKHKKDLKNVIGQPGEYSIVIFGCGHYGYEACVWLEREGYHITSFMDNNQTLWGTKVNHIMVEPPARVQTRYGTAKYLIANEKYSKEIEEQLTSMGVMDKDICIYV